LIVTEKGKEILALPHSDPYNEIYRIQGTGNELKNSGRRYWGLIDPDLLDPEKKATQKKTQQKNPDKLDEDGSSGPWDQYLT